MKKIRKFAIGIGTLASISFPLAIISCGHNTVSDLDKKMKAEAVKLAAIIKASKAAEKVVAKAKVATAN